MKQDENDQNPKKESTPVVGKKPYGKSRINGNALVAALLFRQATNPKDTNMNDDVQQTQITENKAYKLLPDGRKHYLKATGFDIIFSIVMPPYGFFVGLFAFASKGEKRRGATMMIIGACIVALIVTFAVMGAIADSYHVSGGNGQTIDACALFVPLLWLPLCIFLCRFTRKFQS